LKVDCEGECATAAKTGYKSSFTFLDYTARDGKFSSIQNQVFDNGMERWTVKYHHTDAILMVLPAHSVPDQGSTLLLLTLSLLGLVGLSSKPPPQLVTNP
jgi:hypothetical protein